MTFPHLSPQSTGQQDHLFQLIKTLTKAEKRNFRLYVTRNQHSEDVKFIMLFDLLDKQKEYDESAILKKTAEIKKEQLSNLKAHLYKQLLTSLRLLHKNHNTDIEIREHIDYAKVLYNKGLYVQSLRALDKAKGMATLNHQNFLTLEIIEFEKLIESRHITRSGENRAALLARESTAISAQIINASKLSNLSLQMYGFYLQFGHARNDEDLDKVRRFFFATMPDVPESQMGFFEKVYLFQASAWFAFISQDILNYCKFSYKWTALFERSPIMKLNDTSLYLKGVHNLLIGYFVAQKYEKLCALLESTEIYVEKHSAYMDENTKSLSFHHIYTAKINKYFLEGAFTEGLKIIPEIKTGLETYKHTLDQHRILVFYYKIASLYFGSGDNDHAIIYLNQIIQLKVGNLRMDVQCFARLLHLIAHYEKRHYALLEYLVKSVYRFISKNEDLSLTLSEILKFLRKSLYLQPREIRPAFIQLKETLVEFSKSPFEKRNYLYLDIISWLESKIEGKPVETIIRKKFLERSSLLLANE